MLLNPDDPLSEILTIAEAAVEIGRPAATLRDWIRKGQLRVLRIPGSRRTWTTARFVREAEAEIWLSLTTPAA
jgi:predicted site-specific integrase-resolvase